MTEPQEQWAGQFGDDYHARQALPIEARKAMFARILASAPEARSFIEFGAGEGDNLRALRAILPAAQFMGVELNVRALVKLREYCTAIKGSIAMRYRAAEPLDMAFTRGCLIHVQPFDLPIAYENLEAMGGRYVLMIEYYNPKPIAIEYRGQMGLLWKRDFAGEFMTAYPAFKLKDYGFVYHRDPRHPQDDVTWFLMERR